MDLYLLPWKKIIISVTLLASAFCFIPGRTAASNDETTTAYRIHDDVYHSNIRTVNLNRLGHELSFPVINYNAGEQFHLSFDDLDSDVKPYRYTVVHCDATWNLSDLWPTDYLTGFTDDQIDDHRFSFNTLQPYTHYELVFPNDNFGFTLPGNYLLIVYSGNDPDNVAFTRRFSVVDTKVNVEGRIRMPPTSSERTKKHEIGFKINTRQYRIIDPYRNLKVIVRQNNRWDNELHLQPYQDRGNELDYNYADESNTFYAVNEFRTLDLRTVRYLTQGVQEIERDAEGYHFYLWPDQRRTFNAYVYEEDLNGRYQILAEDVYDPAIGSEYVYVHFSLQVDNFIPHAEVFVIGMLSDWQFRDDNRMQYNMHKSAYEATLYLKQGFYNYHYALMNKTEKVADAGFFEGNHADTGNEYTIYVYYREPGNRFDSLIGVKTLNSRDFL
jgi:hypothetical protein